MGALDSKAPTTNWAHFCMSTIIIYILYQQELCLRCIREILWRPRCAFFHGLTLLYFTFLGVQGHCGQSSGVGGKFPRHCGGELYLLCPVHKLFSCIILALMILSTKDLDCAVPCLKHPLYNAGKRWCEYRQRTCFAFRRTWTQRKSWVGYWRAGAEMSSWQPRLGCECLSLRRRTLRNLYWRVWRTWRLTTLISTRSVLEEQQPTERIDHNVFCWSRITNRS